jgi:GNS1/SUR4 family
MCDDISGGHGTFLGLINTFVHIIMYSYYLLTALGPGVQKYLWWKKHITRLQMVSDDVRCRFFSSKCLGASVAAD